MKQNFTVQNDNDKIELRNFDNELINEEIILNLFLIFRLLDICHGQRREREMSLYLVFEHVHQDLASYLEKCPPPGLQPERIKVSVLHRRIFEIV